MRQFVILILGFFLALVAAIALAISFMELPGATVRVAAGSPNGAYAKLARTWKEELAKFGVTLVLTDHEGAGARKAILDGQVEAGVLVGGYSTSLKYFSYGRGSVITNDGDLRSLGRMFDEPVWVYYRRQAVPIEGLQAFKGKRISVGTKASGRSNVIAMLLHANGIIADSGIATYTFTDFPSDAAPLIKPRSDPDAIDVAFLILPSDNQTVKDLLGNPNDILLMTFQDLAGAYLSKFPFLSKVVMDKGAFQLDPKIIPTAQITLLNTAPALVVQKDLHPILATLLTHATVVKPKSSVDPATGYPVMFFKAGKYPHINDPEYEVHEAATAYHKSGELPLLLGSLGQFNARYGIPFWVTAIITEHGTKILLLAIPIFTLLIPFGRFIPALYSWVVRRRLLRWYDRLKAVERTLDRAEATPAQIASAAQELDEIDRDVSALRIPRDFTNQLYELRSYINLVEQRLTARPLREPGNEQS